MSTLVEQQIVPPPPAYLQPEVGSINVDIFPEFRWESVAGATGYEFQLAKETGQQDKFAFPEYNEPTATNTYEIQAQLEHSATYNWRVRAVNADSEGGWATGHFTTEADPNDDDFTILLTVSGVDILQRDTIDFNEDGQQKLKMARSRQSLTFSADRRASRMKSAVATG